MLCRIKRCNYLIPAIYYSIYPSLKRVTVSFCNSFVVFGAEFQKPSGLIAVDSDHLGACRVGRLTPNQCVIAAGGILLPANQGVMMPFCEGLREVGQGPQFGLTLILNMSLTQCRPHPDRLPTRNSRLFRPLLRYFFAA